MISIDKLYEMTLPMLGLESLIMGLTLLIFCKIKKYGLIYNKKSLILLSMAMLTLGLINFTEYFIGVHPDGERGSLAVVIFAASIELFLLQYAYISILNPAYVTKRRILINLLLITLFTTPAVIMIPHTQTLLFGIFFIIGCVFYVTKLIVSIYIYKQQFDGIVCQITNYYSDNSAMKVQWINNTFYVVIAVGAISVLVPLTNFRVLFVYNIFLFLAYLYIYVSVVRNINIFENAMELAQPSRSGIPNKDDRRRLEHDQNKILSRDSIHPVPFMNEHYKSFSQFMDQRLYATPGITAEEVARLLNTNRTKLSSYLNQELNMNYYEWIAQLRVEDAKRLLLENPHMTIVDIAFNVGIEDKSNFGRAFKRIVGLSPLEYRKTNLHNNGSSTMS